MYEQNKIISIYDFDEVVRCTVHHFEWINPTATWFAVGRIHRYPYLRCLSQGCCKG